MWSPGWDAEAKRFASLLNHCFSVAVTTHDRFNSFKLRSISSSADIHFFSNLTRFTRFLPPTNLRKWRIRICGYVKGFHYIFKSRVLFPLLPSAIDTVLPSCSPSQPPSTSPLSAATIDHHNHSTSLLSTTPHHERNSCTIFLLSNYCCHRLLI
ncbi:hypothetical protein LXL04_032330 [Taraxacum kok-saghyz]